MKLTILCVSDYYGKVLYHQTKHKSIMFTKQPRFLTWKLLVCSLAWFYDLYLGVVLSEACMTSGQRATCRWPVVQKTFISMGHFVCNTWTWEAQSNVRHNKCMQGSEEQSSLYIHCKSPLVETSLGSDFDVLRSSSPADPLVFCFVWA